MNKIATGQTLPHDQARLQLTSFQAPSFTRAMKNDRTPQNQKLRFVTLGYLYSTEEIDCNVSCLANEQPSCLTIDSET
jgi:hypothetical protein